MQFIPLYSLLVLCALLQAVGATYSYLGLSNLDGDDIKKSAGFNLAPVLFCFTMASAGSIDYTINFIQKGNIIPPHVAFAGFGIQVIWLFLVLIVRISGRNDVLNRSSLTTLFPALVLSVFFLAL